MEFLLYRFLIFIHVVSAIISIGPFFILIPLIKKLRVAKDKELVTQLDTFKLVVRLSKHSGHVLVGSGILLVMTGPWSWSTPWVVFTLITMFCSLFFLARAFSPTLRKFDEINHNREVLVGKLNRTIWIYIILLLTMLWFMVVKPTL